MSAQTPDVPKTSRAIVSTTAGWLGELGFTAAPRLEVGKYRDSAAMKQLR